MRADFSRYRFDSKKHYSAVLYQQGRVITDSDLNEEHLIQEYRSERTAADVIGPAGTPKQETGFAITVDASSNVTIGKGRYFIDGLLIENESAILYADQEFWKALPTPPGSDIRQQLLAASKSVGLVYLEAIRREVAGSEDPYISESVVGDTTARAQVMWKVQVLPLSLSLGASVRTNLATLAGQLKQAQDVLVAATNDTQRKTARQQIVTARRALDTAAATENISCGRSYAEWDKLVLAPTGKVQLSTISPGTTPKPCDVPPGSGYFSGENQLYRVEVHKTGSNATSADSTFKWSRENASIVALIERAGAATSGDVNAADVQVNSIGRDTVLGFADDDWVEYRDDAIELVGVAGPLVQIKQVKRETQTIVLKTPIDIRFALRPRLRRWDQKTGETGNGLAMTSPTPLERNLQVSFDGGTFRTGDHWIIPARAGKPDSHLPAGFQSPAGMRHYYARLGLVLLDPTNKLHLLYDCRKPIPSLTALDAGDIHYSALCDRLSEAGTVQDALDLLCRTQGSKCTYVAMPGTGWEKVFASIPDGTDAEICFPEGDYPTDRIIAIANKRNLIVTGVGPGTRMRGNGVECVLRFVSCASVTVRDISVETSRAGHGEKTPLEHLNGTLTFQSCLSVDVQNVSAQCAGGPLRAATCITVWRAGWQPNSQVRISDCNLFVGHQQTGILIVNADRSRVTNNVILPGAQPPLNALLQDVDYRAALRRSLISRIIPGAAGAAPPANTNATVTFNSQIVHFQSAATLLATPTILEPRRNRNNNEWQRAITAMNPTGISSPQALKRFLLRLAGALVRTRGTGAGGSLAFQNAIKNLLERDIVTASQGIVFAGSNMDSVHLIGNTVRDALQCIHVSLGEPVDGFADSVTIKDNTLRVSLPTNALRDRHGIFVGNCNSLMIENNYIALLRTALHTNLRVEGIRIFGIMGRRVIVRHNHLGRPAFQVGITFAPLNKGDLGQPLWMITVNEMESVATKVDIPGPSQPGQPGVSDPAAVRKLVRGINDNFA